jgi:hypothetical protein
VNATLTGPSPLQRAALSLHAMCDADRAWVLQALPASQQQVLRPVLDELQALGIPQDARLFDGIVQRPRSTAAAQPAFAEGEADAISELLRAEPPRVTAALLAPADLPWLTARVAGQPVQRSATSAPALQAAVRVEMRRLLDAQGSRRAPASLWQRVRGALQLSERLR